MYGNGGFWGENNSPQNQQFNFVDLLSILSFVLGLQNLKENEQQSAHTEQLIQQIDIDQANEKQALFLLQELGRKFDEQNEMLQEILSRLDRLEQGGKSFED